MENTHEAIVSREVWERANELIAVKRREYRKTLTGDLNIFRDCSNAQTAARHSAAENTGQTAGI